VPATPRQSIILIIGLVIGCGILLFLAVAIWKYREQTGHLFRRWGRRKTDEETLRDSDGITSRVDKGKGVEYYRPLTSTGGYTDDEANHARMSTAELYAPTFRDGVEDPSYYPPPRVESPESDLGSPTWKAPPLRQDINHGEWDVSHMVGEESYHHDEI
jgi:hypothetical protein